MIPVALQPRQLSWQRPGPQAAENAWRQCAPGLLSWGLRGNRAALRGCVKSPQACMRSCRSRIAQSGQLSAPAAGAANQ